MKKISFFLVAVLFAMSNVFVSCSSDDDDDDPFKKPKIEVQVKQGEGSYKEVKTEDVLTGKERESVNFKIKFAMGEDKLTKIRISFTISGETVVKDSVLNEGLFHGAVKELVYDYHTNIADADKKITFSTTDKKGRTAEFYVTLKPKSTSDSYVISGITLVGAQKNNQIGSFYSVSFSEVMLLPQATEVSSAIDFAFFYGATNKATIASITDATIQEMYSKTSSWEKRNKTNFVKMTPKEGEPKNWFDEAKTAVSSATETKVNQLQKGDMVAFKTEKGKIGVFKVSELNAVDSGSISLILYFEK